jgi:parallel beta-helix repeat protein
VEWRDGILLVSDSEYNVIEDNEIRGNGHTGVPMISGSGWNLVQRNVSSGNGDAGFRVESSRNTLLADRANDNGTYGFLVTGNFNKLAFNSGCGNGIEDALQQAGTKGNVWKAKKTSARATSRVRRGVESPPERRRRSNAGQGRRSPRSSAASHPWARIA